MTAARPIREALDPSGTVEVLSRILRGTPRLPGALCVDNPEPFDPDHGDEQAAIQICARCPVLSECAAWADTAGGLYGVVGGRWRGKRPRSRRSGDSASKPEKENT